MISRRTILGGRRRSCSAAGSRRRRWRRRSRRSPSVNVVSRVGGSPQHPVGNGLLAEQFPEERRGFAISAHISRRQRRDGRRGRRRGAADRARSAGAGWSSLFGIPAVVIALAILLFVRETRRRTGRRRSPTAASATRSGRSSRDPDHRWVYLASVLGGGGRGLGVVNLFALLYLSRRAAAAGVDDRRRCTAALIVLSVPMPLVAGWLSDRIGRRPVIIGVLPRRRDRVRRCSCSPGPASPGCGSAIVVMGLFSFAESPQLQALLADIAPPAVRDTSFALYFTLAFGVGSLWIARLRADHRRRSARRRACRSCSG